LNLLNFIVGTRSALLLLCLALVVVPSVLQGQTGDREEASPEQSSAIVLARVKYGGGGDWYNDRSAEVNLLRYVGEHTTMNVRPTFEYVEPGDDRLYTYPMIFLTGHGDFRFDETDLVNMRAYLENGGFLYIDDDYGLDTAARREMNRLFPDQKLVELPFDHPIYHAFYSFPNGLPKIHEHNNKAPQGFGLFDKNGRLCVFYTYETNISDGWVDPEVHNDPEEKREQALRMGTNIIVYGLTH
jgi:hypothetical protein